MPEQERVLAAYAPELGKPIRGRDKAVCESDESKFYLAQSFLYLPTVFLFMKGQPSVSLSCALPFEDHHHSGKATCNEAGNRGRRI